MLSEKQIKQLLLDNKIATEEEIDKALNEAKSKNKPFEEYLYKNKIVNEETLYEFYGRSLNIPFINLENVTIQQNAINLLPASIAQTHKILIFEESEKEIKIASVDPRDLEIFDFIKKKTNKRVKIFLTTPKLMQEALKLYHKGLKAEVEEITQEKHKPTTEVEEESLKKLAQNLPIIKIMDTILEYAIFEEASDIHIEPTEKEIIVRYRVDGILRDAMTLPKQIHSGIVARIKILSNLKLDEHRLPQDGRFNIKAKEYNVSFRVSVIPVFDGEKIVLRLLDESSQVLTLEQLGILPKELKIIKNNIKKPHGMILVTGPTGSGKTTTLYTVLNMLNNPKVNISTVEDPIEYKMARVNQTQVNPRIGLTFAQGLRALLRQDPNVIMVGEIRDNETAEIAIHAAMTGHLVLSTLHTNDAVNTIPRLYEMKIPPFLLATTINIIMAQRLVRKICLHCIESYELTSKNLEQIEAQLNFQNILEILKKEEIIDSNKSSAASLLFYRGHGCKECNHEGYKGRIGIYEIMEVTKQLAELIINEAPQEELTKQALKQGMITMVQDGFIKAKNGITTIEEVLRVTKE